MQLECKKGEATGLSSPTAAPWALEATNHSAAPWPPTQARHHHGPPKAFSYKTLFRVSMTLHSRLQDGAPWLHAHVGAGAGMARQRHNTYESGLQKKGLRGLCAEGREAANGGRQTVAAAVGTWKGRARGGEGREGLATCGERHVRLNAQHPAGRAIRLSARCVTCMPSARERNEGMMMATRAAM